MSHFLCTIKIDLAWVWEEWGAARMASWSAVRMMEELARSCLTSHLHLRQNSHLLIPDNSTPLFPPHTAPWVFPLLTFLILYLCHSPLPSPLLSLLIILLHPSLWEASLKSHLRHQNFLTCGFFQPYCQTRTMMLDNSAKDHGLWRMMVQVWLGLKLKHLVKVS